MTNRMREHVKFGLCWNSKFDL